MLALLEFPIICSTIICLFQDAQGALASLSLANDPLADIRALTRSLLLVLFVSPTFLFPGCFRSHPFTRSYLFAYVIRLIFDLLALIFPQCFVARLFGNMLELLSPS